ncbi:hypothetical protein SALBM135S_06821 [Streptomyces alboniger]
MWRAIAESSKPTSATSSGIRRPDSRSACRAPAAITSEPAKTASIPGQASRSSRIARRPPSSVKSPCATMRSSTGWPASRSAAR